MIIKFDRTFFIEIAAVISGALYTLLISYGNPLCWLFAIISSVLFIYLVYNKQLLAETALHGFYLAMGIYGWATWGAEMPAAKWGDLIQNGYLIGLGILGTLVVGAGLKALSNSSLPFVDAFTTVFSIIATFLMIYAFTENWIYWLVIDAVSIVLYASRGLYLSALLYVVYLGLVINGLMEWTDLP